MPVKPEKKKKRKLVEATNAREVRKREKTVTSQGN